MMGLVVVTANKLKPFTHAFGPYIGGSHPKAVVSGFFVFFHNDSESMRYVGGGVLNNPVTRANQSREGGLRIEPGGRDESFAYAP
jgi:hypothetical protein